MQTCRHRGSDYTIYCKDCIHNLNPNIHPNNYDCPALGLQFQPTMREFYVTDSTNAGNSNKSNSK